MGLSEPALDLELFKRDQQNLSDLRQRKEDLIDNPDQDESDTIEYRQQLTKFFQEWSDTGQSRLADYVATRKAILSYLYKQLERRQDGKYELEEDVHNIIFPMRTTSDDEPFDDQNLWIIDERLAYHQYLASDLPLKSATPISIDDRKEPDLLIFGSPVAFAESWPDFGHITIIEFKRPMRKDYTDKENPIKQVYGYIEKIKQGKGKTKDGRPIDLPKNTPFYAYIICDLTDKLKEFATYAMLKQTPDGKGYFGFHPDMGVYLEIISFDKLISDALKRNRIFFDKLNLGTNLVDPGLIQPEQSNSRDKTS